MGGFLGEQVAGVVAVSVLGVDLSPSTPMPSQPELAVEAAEVAESPAPTQAVVVDDTGGVDAVRVELPHSGSECPYAASDSLDELINIEDEPGQRLETTDVLTNSEAPELAPQLTATSRLCKNTAAEHEIARNVALQEVQARIEVQDPATTPVHSTPQSTPPDGIGAFSDCVRELNDFKATGADWQENATLVTDPHPDLSESQKKKVFALDYGLKGGKVTNMVRRALLYSAPRRFGLDLASDVRQSQDQQTVLLRISGMPG